MTPTKLKATPSLRDKLLLLLMMHPSSSLPSSLLPPLYPAKQLLEAILELRKLCYADIRTVQAEGVKRREDLRRKHKLMYVGSLARRSEATRRSNTPPPHVIFEHLRTQK